MELGFGTQEQLTYLKIENGKITVSAKEGDAGAKSRQIAKGKSAGKVVYFKEYPSYTERIRSVTLREAPWSKHEKLISIRFKGASLDIPLDSGNGTSFVLRCQAIDLKEPVKFKPYKIEREDKPGSFSTGVTLYQESGKLESTLDWKEHVPALVKLPRPINGQEWDKTDRLNFFEAHLQRWIDDNNLKPGNAMNVEEAQEEGGFEEEESDEIPF